MECVLCVPRFGDTSHSEHVYRRAMQSCSPVTTRKATGCFLPCKMSYSGLPSEWCLCVGCHPQPRATGCNATQPREEYMRALCASDPFTTHMMQLVRWLLFAVPLWWDSQTVLVLAKINMIPGTHKTPDCYRIEYARIESSRTS